MSAVVSAEAKVIPSEEHKTKRDPATFAHLRTTRGYLLAIALPIIALLPIHYVMKIALIIVVATIVGIAIMHDGPTQNLLIRTKNWLERQWR